MSEDGYRGIPKKLYRDGLLVVGYAAGFVINTGYSIRGIDLAILSGIAAARAIIQEENPSQIGQIYMKELNNIKLLPTMKAVDGYKEVLEIPRIYTSYPAAANDLFNTLFSIDGEVPVSIKKELKTILKKNGLSMWQLIKDGIRGYKSV